MNFFECISRLNIIDEQYEIALFAFDLYQKKKETEISNSLEQRKAKLSSLFERIKREKSTNDEQFDESAFKEDFEIMFNISEQLLSYPAEQAKQLKNSIRQNSLIITLSTFEIFLNDLLRFILTNKPDLLRPNRKVEISRLINLGADTIIADEVERQVYAIDRKNIADRADYFKTHLNLRWSKDVNLVKTIEKMNDLRNNIVHKDTTLLVREEDFKETHKMCKSIVVQLTIDFKKHYYDIIAPLILQKENK